MTSPSGRRLRTLGLSALVGAGLVACAGPNLWTDWTSVSTGHSNDGRLRRPQTIPREGEGFVVPERWAARGNTHGVEELVLAVQRAAAAVAGGDPQVLLGIADLSPKAGGRSRWHRSHQSGRDIDILFYSTDPEGQPLPPPAEDMIHYQGDGLPHAPRRVKYVEAEWEGRRFDDARNWALLEGLLMDPSIRIQWIFVSDGLRKRLLDYAIAAERPAWVVEYAEVVLRQPADSLPHDDHFHLRIYCSRSDRFFGCLDRGPVWHHEKRSFKYAGVERYDPLRWRLATAMPILAGFY